MPVAAPDHSPMQHYIIHIDQDGGAEPLVLSVTVASDARALELAQEWLARSDDHRAARVWRGDEHLYDIERRDG